MKFGLALPQYDYSVPGQDPLEFETIAEHARAAERVGFDSVWLSDHLFLDLAKYGGPEVCAGAYVFGADVGERQRRAAVENGPRRR